MISGDFFLRSGEILEIGSLPTKSGELTGMETWQKHPNPGAYQMTTSVWT